MTVEEFLYETVVELVDVDEDDLTRDLTLEDLGLTSLDYVEIQVLIRKRYHVEIAPELLTSGEVRTLGDFADYIRRSASRPADVKAA